MSIIMSVIVSVIMSVIMSVVMSVVSGMGRRHHHRHLRRDHHSHLAGRLSSANEPTPPPPSLVLGLALRTVPCVALFPTHLVSSRQGKKRKKEAWTGPVGFGLLILPLSLSARHSPVPAPFPRQTTGRVMRRTESNVCLRASIPDPIRVWVVGLHSYCDCHGWEGKREKVCF